MTTDIGFTGTRAGCTPEQLRALTDILSTLFDNHGAVWMHNGDAIGCDNQAATIWYILGGKIFLRPCDHKDRGHFPHADKIAPRRKPLDRNKDIVNASSIIVGCPVGMEETQRGGTWSTIRYATNRGRRVIIIYPDGSVEKRNFRDEDPLADFTV